MSDEKIYKITIEGQTLDLPAEIAATDEGLKAALQPFFPGAANAKFLRTEKDGVVTVNVVKQAGTKGARRTDTITIKLSGDVGFRQSMVDLVYNAIMDEELMFEVTTACNGFTFDSTLAPSSEVEEEF